MMDHVKSEFGNSISSPVTPARIPEFYKPPMEIRVEEWQPSHQFAGNCFLLGAQLAAPLMKECRIIAITHSPGARSGVATLWGWIGKSRHGVSGALLRRRPCQAWYHRNSLSCVIFGAANLVDAVIGWSPT